MKKFIYIALTILLIFNITACTNQPEDKTNSEMPIESTTEMIQDETKESETNLEYREEYMEIKDPIEMETYNFDDYLNEENIDVYNLTWLEESIDNKISFKYPDKFLKHSTTSISDEYKQVINSYSCLTFGDYDPPYNITYFYNKGTNLPTKESYELTDTITINNKVIDTKTVSYDDNAEDTILYTTYFISLDETSNVIFEVAYLNSEDGLYFKQQFEQGLNI